MKDISNTYHLRNNKPSKSRRVPSGPLTMSYDTLCHNIRNVLEERGIKTSGIYGDDLRNMLSEQQDFKEDKKWTRLILKVNELGGDGAYAPKYHPELQIPIEQGWCDAKKKFKDMQDFKSKRQRKWWNESIIV
eukprot:25955_1